MLTIKTTSTNFCVEISRKSFVDLLDSESFVTQNAAFRTGFGSLCRRLENIKGVSDVRYDNMSGPNVFLTVDHENNRPEMIRLVMDTIEQHLEWCADLAKDPRVIERRAFQPAC